MFGQAEESQARVLKGVLDSFCGYFGHRINAHKTNLCFSKGVDDDLGVRLCNILGFHKVKNLGTYLGVPLFHDRVTNNILRFIVDMVRSKLQSWDVRKLQIAGRATLT